MNLPPGVTWADDVLDAGAFVRHARERSLHTVLVYLNDGFEGGETSFPELDVTPSRGAALVLEHRLIHTGATVRAGRKYVLRTDVMYRADG